MLGGEWGTRMSGRILKRFATVAAMVAAAVLGFAPAAWANWESEIVDWSDGGTSHEWHDEYYSQILFYTCWAQGANVDRLEIAMWEFDAFSSDEYYGEKTYTGCFNSVGSRSEGHWTGLPEADDYFFEVDQVAQGGSCCLLTVAKVYVDRTKADA